MNYRKNPFERTSEEEKSSRRMIKNVLLSGIPLVAGAVKGYCDSKNITFSEKYVSTMLFNAYKMYKGYKVKIEKCN